MSESKVASPPDKENSQEESPGEVERKEKSKKSLTAKKKYYVPGFYWNAYQPKSYGPTPSLLRGGFVNKEQKRFYYFMTIFKFAKVAAIILVALFIIGWL